MKYTIICTFLFFTACNGILSEDVLNGVYTASYEHEFGKTDDTLTLFKANSSAKMYRIERHSGLIKKLDGKEFPKELVTESWILEYDAEKQILTELTKGKILVWNSGTLSLQLGEKQYIRIGSK